MDFDSDQFELAHLDLMPSNSGSGDTFKAALTQTELAPQATVTTQSLILNEVQKEMEELQNKMKLNHRRLLLFEAENNKLIEEKNRLFFEMQNVAERNKILLEKNSYLETENEEIEGKIALLQEKVQSYAQINQTQQVEIRRYSKFHLKIQNVIKPYIQQLKDQIEDLKGKLTYSEKMNSELSNQNIELLKKLTFDNDTAKMKIASLEADKNQTIAHYEEQIHSFSKELVHLEQKNTDLAQEVQRLKKSVEFKNYFENELIKFKRIHEEDQREIFNLKEKTAQLTVQLTDKAELAASLNEKQMRTETQLENAEHILETTRTQLLNQIEHANQLNERLTRLEKLNLNLSQQMQSNS